MPDTSPLAPEPVVEEEIVKPAGWFAAEEDSEDEATQEPAAAEATVVDAEITQTRLTTDAAEPEITQTRPATDAAELEITQARLATDAVESTATRLTADAARTEITPARVGSDSAEVSEAEITQARLTLEDVPEAAAVAEAHRGHSRDEDEPAGDVPEWIAAVQARYGRHERSDADERPGRHEQPAAEPLVAAHLAAEGVAPDLVEAEEPLRTAEEPVPTAAEPVAAAVEPILTPVEPVLTAEEPVHAAEELAPTAEEPVNAADEPALTAEEPARAADEPVLTEEEPVFTVVTDLAEAVAEDLVSPAPGFADQPVSAAPVHADEPVGVDEPVDSGVDLTGVERPVSAVPAGVEADAPVGPGIPVWPPIKAVTVALAEAEPVAAVTPTSEPVAVAAPVSEPEPVAAAPSVTEPEPVAAVETLADGGFESLGGERDGGASADAVSAGAGPASGDAHDTSEPGSTVEHHHDGTGPAFALTDDTATETSAAVPAIVAVPADGGTDSGSATVDAVAEFAAAEGTGTPASDAAETPAVDAAEVAETPAVDTPEVAETPAVETAEIGETPAAETAEVVASPAVETAEMAGAPAGDAGEAGAEVASAGPGAEAVAAGAGNGADDVRTRASGSEREKSRNLDPEEVVAPIRQRRDQRAPADRRRADPEQILAAYPWMFDPETLREQVDEPDRLWDLVDRLSDRLEFAERDTVRAGLLTLRAVVSRVLGELDDALADGREGLRHAESAGEARMISVAQARLAHVLQWRGEFEEADRLYARADSPELPARLRAEIYELAGRSAYEQGRFLEAVNRFERALDLCQDRDPELVERIELALDVIARRSGDGWGPYPRRREELLELPAAPMLLPDEGAGLWGYAAAVEPKYAQAQAFAEGVAWVRRPDSPAWELIDPSGAVVIGADSGYLAADRFSEGLAWVTREADGGWSAIDRENRLIVPGGFEDVRPFRRGLALFRRAGGWGAVDRHGRIVVQPKWRQVATVLSTGGPIDGFSDEGFLVVDGGTGFGVIDQNGQQVIPPVHKAVVIHPSAFLIADEAGRWGAVDRQGQPLVETRYTERAEAIEEVVRLRPDARPVL
ncbi:WG repeat-containing protein [Actinoplanes cyaneus]|uniref:WG repeat-containing protein n=1 Tax=Actinoplanes cyaneus TaxID=52696 RepID=UPI001943A00D|nr:WG repeat-containing protein [Actinoplanes cyaneus]